MNKLSVVIIFLLLVTCSLFLSGCIDITKGSVNDPIVGAWKPQNPVEVIYTDQPNGNMTVINNSVTIGYPNDTCHFYSNGTFERYSGECQVINGSLWDGFYPDMNETTTAIGTWKNIGNNNYVISVKLSNSMSIDKTYILKDGHLQNIAKNAEVDIFIRA